MPRRDDLHRILIIGSGPIVIGQACEFDYSGTQACKALREEGYEVILVNSNPATIMTDPTMADRTYVEPIDADVVARVIEIERPDALLPTLGGQTGLNTAIQLHERGVLERFGVEMIGARYEAIRKAEDRNLFREAMANLGLKTPVSAIAYTLTEAMAARDRIGLPAVIRPSFTLGGTGGGIAYNIEEFERICGSGLELSLNTEILIEKSVIGWKEFELEVMRDYKDNCVVICSIENFDPMGVHTGDSITVAPAQTLTDREYQLLRDASFAILREIGVETGGSNVQMAINPVNGEMVIIEMNPRVSRSSALASKATGFPIARMAAKLAVGYSLDEIENQITKQTPACFEPTIDYCVVKIPRFAFEKFPGVDPTLTTQMKSVGETMAMGRTFKEALQKAIRSLEVSRAGLGLDKKDHLLPHNARNTDQKEILGKLSIPSDNRLYWLRYALKTGIDARRIQELSGIDPWFLDNLAEIIEMERELEAFQRIEDLPHELLLRAKRMGFSDLQLATLYQVAEEQVTKHRKEVAGIKPAYKLVDTCGAEFASETPYFYSTYEEDTEVVESGRKKIMILGGGPNRIGQGIEFDYCCVQASYALREAGYETIMVNSNPETVSTDFDTSDQLFFEPVTLEDVMHIYETQKIDGVIVQFGGQTPLNLAHALLDRGLPILGTSPVEIDRAEDRELFKEVLERLNLRQAENGIARSTEEALIEARRIGYPVVVRPSFVLGGRAMSIVYSEEDLRDYMEAAVEASPEKPVLIDDYIEHAIEVDVDVVADGNTAVVGGIMEHIEEAGVHSGDSACVLPPHTLSEPQIDRIRVMAHALARELNVCGLMNMQLAIKGEEIYVLEVNPRASRTVPFVSKAIGISLARIAARVMAGESLQDIGFTEEIWPEHFCVKAPVFPFSKLPGSDTLLGPEMKSTGEVMGIDEDLGLALAKAYLGAGQTLPTEGSVFVSVKDSDKRDTVEVTKTLNLLGLNILATHGTYRALKAAGVEVSKVFKIGRGRPHVLDIIKNRDVGLVINTPSPDPEAQADEETIRRHAVTHGIPAITTIHGARAAVAAIHSLKRLGLRVKALQDFHASPVGS